MTKKKEEIGDDNKEKKQIKAIISREKVVTESSSDVKDLYEQSRYGILLDDGRIQLSLIEAFYLLGKKRLAVFDNKNNLITNEKFAKKAEKIDKNFWVKYSVYKDMRNRGYIVKTALKFGADFRVYDRGVKPGEDHARWIIYPVHESEHLTWYEFAAKNRVAHSTKKRLLVGIVDDEGDVTYYEIRWMRP